jgi:diguanylate cyclase (GGDEF)-like protein
MERVRTVPLGEVATGIVRSGDQVAMVAAGAIHPHTDKLPPITGGYSILIYADMLNASAVDKLQQAYLLDDLRLVPTVPSDSGAVLPLLPASGPPLAYLTWNPERPGARLLAVGLPVLGALAVATAGLAAFFLLHARRAANDLSHSRQSAQTDILTGLPNRLLLEDKLKQAILTFDAKNGAVAVLCLDLDGFKAVNDLHGHSAGDELLRQVAIRLQSVLRTADIVARVGGDEFVVVQTAPNQQAVEKLAERLLNVLSEPFLLQGIPVSIGASIGLSFAGGFSETGWDLLRRADMALYDAKRAGRNRYRVSEAGNSARKIYDHISS